MNDQNIFARNPTGIRDSLKVRSAGIAGLGGIGSHAALHLARAGIGRMILADCDRVEWSNLNRQAYFRRDVGQPKTDALSEYLLQVNPGLKLDTRFCRLKPFNVPEIFGEADILIEALDRAEAKKWLIESWSALHPERYVVVCSGISGYGNSNGLSVVRAGRLVICGDQKSDPERDGLLSARVAAVAAMQANEAIRLVVDQYTGESEG